MKTEDERIQECIQIRKQLTSIGAMMLDENREKLKNEMKKFVYSGQSTRFSLNLIDKAKAIIELKSSKKSGITLQH